MRPAPQDAAQALAAQTCPAVQARPHMPQLALSLVRLWQVAPQAVWPTGQEIWQVPAVHT